VFWSQVGFSTCIRAITIIAHYQLTASALMIIHIYKAHMLESHAAVKQVNRPEWPHLSKVDLTNVERLHSCSVCYSILFYDYCAGLDLAQQKMDERV